jgi:hypothetical protein
MELCSHASTSHIDGGVLDLVIFSVTNSLLLMCTFVGRAVLVFFCFFRSPIPPSQYNFKVTCSHPEQFLIYFGCQSNQQINYRILIIGCRVAYANDTYSSGDFGLRLASLQNMLQREIYLRLALTSATAKSIWTSEPMPWLHELY